MSHFNVIDAKNPPPISLLLPQRITLHIYDDGNYTVCEDFLNQSYAAGAGAAQTLSPQIVTSREVARAMWDFVGPVIFSIGILGNILILLVMRRPTMRGTSTCAYLTMMAVADIMVLFTGMLPEWLEASGFLTFKELHPYTCKFEKFLFYTSSDTAIWLRVQFTLDRFMAVCFPMSDTDCCLPWRAKYYGLGALMTAIAKNLHVFMTRGAEYTMLEKYLTTNCTWAMRPTNVSYLISNCGSPTAAYKHFETFVRPWFAFATVSVLPFVVILVCNIAIVITLINVKRKQAELQLISAAQDRNIFQMTAMCLAASFCFLICTAPSIILLIGKPYWNDPPSGAYEITKALNNQIYYINHSANFFLYCLTGKRFREALVHIFRPYDNIAASLRQAYTTSLIVSSSQTGSSNAKDKRISQFDVEDRDKEVRYNGRPVHYRQASQQDTTFEELSPTPTKNLSLNVVRTAPNHSHIIEENL